MDNSISLPLGRPPSELRDHSFSASQHRRRHHSRAERAICTDSRAERVVNRWKERGYAIIVIEGVFDLLHYNHFRAFEKAKQICRQKLFEAGKAVKGVKLLVRLNDDEFVKSRPEKDPLGPILPLAVRLKNISHVKHVDCVTVRNRAGFEWLSWCKPDFVMRSVTTKSQRRLPDIISEIEAAAAALSPETRILVLDEKHRPVSSMKEVDRLHESFKTRQNRDHVSSSSIRKEIRSRAISKFLSEVPGSIREELAKIYEKQADKTHQAKRELKLVISQIVNENAELVLHSTLGVKKKDAWLSKVAERYAGNYSKIADTVRGTLVARDIEKVYQLKKKLEEAFGEKVAFSDQFAQPNALGFRMLNVTITLQNGTMAEIQIHTPRTLFSRGERREVVRTLLGGAEYNYLVGTCGLELAGGHKFYEQLKELQTAPTSLESAMATVRLIQEAQAYHSCLFEKGT